METAGYVLAGGRSQRMGRDKALLAWGGRTLLEHVAGLVREAVGNVTVVGPPSRYAGLGLRVIPDVVAGRGPLGGLYTALRDAAAERVLIAACDMPYLTPELLRQLAATAGDAVVTDSGRLHPLCAVYHRKLLPLVEGAIRAGALRMHDLLAAAAVRRVAADPAVVANLNTPQDLVAQEGA
jgi:molybdopterin-guanine dinucleotide biosynthesis protein A